MSRSDPQRITGQPYPPPSPRCTCGAIHAVHEPDKHGSRGACPFTGCKQYTPGAAP